jgi:hypothetical protein
MKKLLAISLLAITACLMPGAARADLVFANTTGGRLISFDSATPGTLQSNVGISGVLGDLVGIDFRPANTVLYGVGNNAGIGTVYTINTVTGVASSILSGFALNGTSFGVDFNPVADALRIVSNTGQNLRITAGGSGVVNVDGTLNIGATTATGVVGAAYTNNFAGATSTTLFVVQDNVTAGTDMLFIQNPPNNGTLTTPITLAINVSQLSGFDITADNRAFLSWNGGNQFGSLNLSTGSAVNFGAIGGGFAGQIAGIAVTVPEPSTLAMIGTGVAICLAWRRKRGPRKV